MSRLQVLKMDPSTGFRILMLLLCFEGAAGRSAPCVCTFELNHVCGTDGVSYPNPCTARCSGAEVESPGRCKSKTKPGDGGNSTCVCPAIFDPVCGINGRTYSSQCQAICRGITVKHTGSCFSKPAQLPAVGDESPPRETPCACGRSYLPVCGTDGKTYDNSDCAEKCGGVRPAYDGPCKLPHSGSSTNDDDKSCICPAIYDPVCGVNGKTYPSECQAKCRGVKALKTGICNGVPSQLPAKNPNARSCACNRSYLPVCGTDGKTYDNMDCAERCGGVSVAYQGRCKSAEDGAKTKPCICPENYLPACGTDGKTYANECLAKCSGTTVARRGECNAFQNGGAKSNRCICLTVYAPVCGIDGKTYGNRCEAKCSGVTVVRNGQCASSEGFGGSKPCLCPDIYDPVCGQDGSTYSSGCQAKCSRVTVAYRGRCSSGRETRGSISKGSPPCICSLDYSPVCGSDGITYGNSCEAKCSHVKVLGEGPCEIERLRKQISSNGACACNRSLLPVCGNDGRTYANPDCAMNCGGVADFVIGECESACACSKNYDPVCNINTGTKYVNSCFARCLKADEELLQPCDDN